MEYYITFDPNISVKVKKIPNTVYYWSNRQSREVNDAPTVNKVIRSSLDQDAQISCPWIFGCGKTVEDSEASAGISVNEYLSDRSVCTGNDEDNDTWAKIIHLMTVKCTKELYDWLLVNDGPIEWNWDNYKKEAEIGIPQY